MSTVSVNNLPENCDEEDLRDLFDQFGHITNIHMPKNSVTHAHCGVAFIAFSQRMHAARAVNQLNGTSYRNCVLEVSLANLDGRQNEQTLRRNNLLRPRGQSQTNVQNELNEVLARRRALSEPDAVEEEEEEDEIEFTLLNDAVRARAEGAAAEERLAAAASEDAWAVAVAPANDAMRARFDRAAAAAAARADESELSPRLKKILHEIDSVLAEAVDAGNTHEGVYLQVANLLKKAYENDHEESFRAHFRQLLEDDGFRIADNTA